MEEIVQREKMDVHDQYVKAARKRKTMTFAGLAFLIAIEGFATYGMHKTVDSENLQNRVFREYDIRSKGQIETAKGIYFGDTDFGYFSGNGKFAFNTKTEYSGQWSENQFEGKGSLHVPDHGVYEGEFSESLKNGKGTFTWNDKTVYEGEWKKDQMDGAGKYTSPNGVVYSGMFRKNTFSQRNEPI